MAMKLQGKLDAMRADFENGRFPLVPTRTQLETMRRATQSLVDSGQADNALKAGDTAPEFTLEDADGNSVSSRALLARGPLIATFYRGVWCPYCNYDLQALEEMRLEIEARGASLVALSPQTPANSRSIACAPAPPPDPAHNSHDQTSRVVRSHMSGRPDPTFKG
jgi:hypothetical protein